MRCYNERTFVAEAEGYDTDKNDLEFLLDKLRELSRRFSVDWAIQIDGSEIGSIDNGVRDPAVQEAVEAMASVADDLGDLADFM